VFQTIAERARAVSGWDYCILSSFDGELVRQEANAGFPQKAVHDLPGRLSPYPPIRGTAAGRAILTGQLVNITDTRADSEYQIPWVADLYRSLVGVPLIRNGQAIGALTIGRKEPGGAPEKLVRLLQTFADLALGQPRWRRGRYDAGLGFILALARRAAGDPAITV
jgi:GAF domain-containing protein